MGGTHDNDHERRTGKLSDKDFQLLADRLVKVSSPVAAKMAADMVWEEMQKARAEFREEIREELRNIHAGVRTEAEKIISEAVGGFTLKELIPFSWKITKRIIFLALASLAGWLGWKYQMPK